VGTGHVPAPEGKGRVLFALFDGHQHPRVVEIYQIRAFLSLYVLKNELALFTLFLKRTFF